MPWKEAGVGEKRVRNIYTHPPRPSAPLPCQGAEAGRRGALRALDQPAPLLTPQRGPEENRGNAHGRGRPHPERRKHTPTTTNPAQQHPPSPCGSAEPRPAQPPRRPGAYPEVANCVPSPSAAAGRCPAPGSGAPSAPAAARPALGPPPARPPSRPSPAAAAAAACACARVAASLAGTALLAPRLPVPPGGGLRRKTRPVAARPALHGAARVRTRT